MKINGFYVFIAVLFAGMLYLGTRYFRGSAGSAVGVAETKDFKINSEKAAQVKSVRVVPGQQVNAGDLLVELTSSELESDIVKLKSRIEVLKDEQIDRGKLSETDIAYVRAQTRIEVGEIDADIQRISSELKLNKSLTREFSSGDTSSAGPQDVRLAGLRQQRQEHLDAAEIKIHDIRQESIVEQRQMTNQIQLMARELGILLEEQKGLNKFAVVDGVVESVYVREGEQVEAFSSLLSIDPVRPTTVVIYLINSQGPELPIGSEVNVRAYERRSAQVRGKIIGFGAVRTLPDILQKSTAVKAFGREVFIEISPDNDFANGEKVLVR